MSITWVEKDDLIAAGMKAMQPSEVLLDIGCGIVPQNFIRPNVHICCEPCLEYVENLRANIAAFNQRDRSYVLLHMGWREVVRYFPEDSVDTILLIDVIEHLEKDVGRELLALTERIARRQVIVFTPLGFMPQKHLDGMDAWGLSGGGWQEHKSGWVPEDFSGAQWEFYAAREFHTADSSGRVLEDAFGAFWAIRTCLPVADNPLMKRETALQLLEVGLRQQKTLLLHQQKEINGLVLARVERKIRRVFRGMFSK